MIKHCILTEMLSFCTLLQYFYLLKQCIQLDNDIKVIYSAITKSAYKIRSLFAFEQTDLNLPNVSCLPQLSQGLYTYYNYVGHC